MRVTRKMIDNIIEEINKKENRPLGAWTRQDNGNFIANIGNLHFYICLGVFALHEIVTEGGGVNVPYSASTKKELYAYLNGRFQND